VGRPHKALSRWVQIELEFKIPCFFRDLHCDSYWGNCRSGVRGWRTGSLIHWKHPHSKGKRAKGLDLGALDTCVASVNSSLWASCSGSNIGNGLSYRDWASCLTWIGPRKLGMGVGKASELRVPGWRWLYGDQWLQGRKSWSSTPSSIGYKGRHSIERVVRDRVPWWHATTVGLNTKHG